MEKNDILEWLRNQEEFLLWNLNGIACLQSAERGAGDMAILKEWRDELQIVRDLKKIVTESYRWASTEWDEEPLNPVDYRKKWEELVEIVAVRMAQDNKK